MEDLNNKDVNLGIFKNEHEYLLYEKNNLYSDQYSFKTKIENIDIEIMYLEKNLRKLKNDKKELIDHLKTKKHKIAKMNKNKDFLKSEYTLYITETLKRKEYLETIYKSVSLIYQTFKDYQENMKI